MCGIIGVISSEEFDLMKLIKMIDTLTHRGPDGEGVYYNENKSVILGHRRLLIIDLSTLEKQPMSHIIRINLQKVKLEELLLMCNRCVLLSYC